MKIIQTLHNLGVIQSIASKTHSIKGMYKMKELGIEKYFILPQLTPENKSISIKKIAKLLHIELQKIVFIDNDFLELKEVSSELPQVTCIDATNCEESIYKQLKHILKFDEDVL